MSEFDLIRRHFSRVTPNALLGVGDDAALLQISEGDVLAVSCDMLVCGTHFFADTDPYLLGHKTLAVNLSDMAAMGARPRWATLALSLPKIDEAWLEQFSAGFFALAQQHDVELVGGDTTRGSLNLCVTIMGEVPQGKALRRDSAKVGDEVWVSGTLGDAALGLAHLQGKTALPGDARIHCLAALHQPVPRVALGLALRGIATSAIDISDGLLSDLGHILEFSQVGAEINFQLIKTSSSLREHLAIRLSQQAGNTLDSRLRGNDDIENIIQHCILSGGDDYELCFTAPAALHAEVLSISAKLNLPLTRIGKIIAGQGCIVRDATGNPLNLASAGYDHFR
jgi:thiamine-monophosphate kinase